MFLPIHVRGPIPNYRKLESEFIDVRVAEYNQEDDRKGMSNGIEDKMGEGRGQSGEI